MSIATEHYAYLILWLVGGINALLLIETKEAERNGGRNVVSYILEDIKDKPVPATVGYTLTLLGGWFSFFKTLFFE